jgi:ABC-type branched-subunit amino acid transport system substrate-binding protein
MGLVAIRRAAAALSCLAAGVLAAAAGQGGTAASGPASAAAPADPVAEGKRIYRFGHGAAGPEIAAVIGGEGGSEVSAAELPCAGCHGADGRGRPEGGITPSDLTWEALTRPYGVDQPGGRRRPPYDERSLKRAITLGIDAGGSPLQPAMPRYRLTQVQAAALIAYLRRLGHEVDPGVTAERLRVGVLLPPGPESGEVRRELDAFAAHLAAGGGIYGRNLEIRYLSPEGRESPAAWKSVDPLRPPPPARQPPSGEPAAAPQQAGAPPRPSPPEPETPAAARRATVERFLADQQVFALVASAFAGAEEELADLAAEQELPVIGALTASPRAGPPLNRYVFYLLPGLAEQARALVEAAAGGLDGTSGRLGLLVPGTPGGLGAAAPGRPGELAETEAGRSSSQDLPPPRLQGGFAASRGGLSLQVAAEAARDQCRRLGVEPWVAGYAPLGAQPADPGSRRDGSGLGDSVAAASRAGVGALVFLGAEADARELLERAGALGGWRPRVYLLAALAAGAVPDAPEGLAGRLYLAAPGLPSHLSAKGLELLRLAGPASPPDAIARSTAYSRAALAAIETLREALTRCGREVSRERLIAALEELRGFDTGLGPALTFGPDRRIGAIGAYIVTYDPRQGTFAAAGGWVSPR